MTVEVEQENGDRVVGDSEATLSAERTHPEGILVKFESDVRGRVKRVRADV